MIYKLDEAKFREFCSKKKYNVFDDEEEIVYKDKTEKAKKILQTDNELTCEEDVHPWFQTNLYLYFNGSKLTPSVKKVKSESKSETPKKKKASDKHFATERKNNKAISNVEFNDCFTYLFD